MVAAWPWSEKTLGEALLWVPNLKPLGPEMTTSRSFLKGSEEQVFKKLVMFRDGNLPFSWWYCYFFVDIYFIICSIGIFKFRYICFMVILGNSWWTEVHVRHLCVQRNWDESQDWLNLDKKSRVSTNFGLINLSQVRVDWCYKSDSTSRLNRCQTERIAARIVQHWHNQYTSMQIWYS